MNHNKQARFSDTPRAKKEQHANRLLRFLRSLTTAAQTSSSFFFAPLFCYFVFPFLFFLPLFLVQYIGDSDIVRRGQEARFSPPFNPTCSYQHSLRIWVGKMAAKGQSQNVCWGKSTCLRKKVQVFRISFLFLEVFYLKKCFFDRFPSWILKQVQFFISNIGKFSSMPSHVRLFFFTFFSSSLLFFCCPSFQ